VADGRWQMADGGWQWAGGGLSNFVIPRWCELNVIMLREFVDNFVILTKEESQQT
jgi:hypothetical protein